MTALGIVGGGQMAEALISGLLAKKAYLTSEILVSDPSPERRDYLKDKFKVAVTENNRKVSQCSVLLLAVKPQVFSQIVKDMGAVAPDRLLLSILAGVSLQQLETAFPGSPVVRVMPNTPALIAQGISALSYGKQVGSEQQQTAQNIFKAVGTVVEVPESLMDAVTGLSGSGPGYVALLVEALMDGGVLVGLPRPLARSLVLETIKGSVALLQEQNLHPGELKDRVTSPGGTTIAGIAALEKAGVRSALIQAVEAATQRSKALGS
jgi:pyrroline-5-carboxylate reductase